MPIPLLVPSVLQRLLGAVLPLEAEQGLGYRVESLLGGEVGLLPVFDVGQVGDLPIADQVAPPGPPAGKPHGGQHPVMLLQPGQHILHPVGPDRKTGGCRKLWLRRIGQLRQKLPLHGQEPPGERGDRGIKVLSGKARYIF